MTSRPLDWPDTACFVIVQILSSLGSVSKRPYCMFSGNQSRIRNLLSLIHLLIDSFREIDLESMTFLYRRYIGLLLITILIYISLFRAFLIPDLP